MINTPSLSLPSDETPVDVYDVFISHAGEDRRKVARPLARRLEALGLRVWLDDTKVTVGDFLRTVIDQALTCSRFGVVILSPSYFKKSWTQYELDGLLAKCDGTKKIILPVWHNVTKVEVASFSLGLAGLAAVPTTLGIKEVANRISRAILHETAPKPHTISPLHGVVNSTSTSTQEAAPFERKLLHSPREKHADFLVGLRLLGRRDFEKAFESFSCAYRGGLNFSTTAVELYRSMPDPMSPRELHNLLFELSQVIPGSTIERREVAHLLVTWLEGIKGEDERQEEWLAIGRKDRALAYA